MNQRFVIPVLAASLLCVAAPSAGASLSLHDAAGRPAVGVTRWAGESLAPLPDADVLVAFNSRRSYCPAAHAACALPDPIRMWLTPGDPFGRTNFYHELGHVFDYSMLTDSDRARFQSLVRIPSDQAWRSAAPNSPHEQFAEGYMACSMLGAGYTLGKLQDWSLAGGAGFGYGPTRARQREVCALIAEVAAR